MSAFVPGIELSRQSTLSSSGLSWTRGSPACRTVRHCSAAVPRCWDSTTRCRPTTTGGLAFCSSCARGTRLRVGEAVADSLRRELPPLFREWPVDHEIHTVRGYFLERLGVDVYGEIEARDWLTFPEQSLRMFTSGAVHHDELGLQAVRGRLAYYPRDVWLYLLVAGWWRVHPEVNLVGRAGAVGDELGSALIGSRLVTDLMRLCF